MGVDAVALLQTELRADESFIACRHVFKSQLSYFVCRRLQQRLSLDEYSRLRSLRTLFQFLGQSHQFVPMFHSSLLTSADESVNSCMTERGGTITFNVHKNGNIGDSKVVLELVLTVHIDDLREHRASGSDFVGSPRLVLHRYTDDIVGSHLLGDIDREVVAHTAIDQHHIAYSHRREGTGNRHTGSHRHTEHSAMEDILCIIDYVCCHAGKRDGQLVEVDGVIVGRGKRVEQSIDVLSDDHSSFRSHSVLSEFQTCGDDIGVLLLALLQTLVAQVVLVREHVGPVLSSDDGIEFGSTVAAGIETSYDASHAGARDKVYGNACTLHNPQRTDVCNAFCAATTEHNTHLGPWLNLRPLHLNFAVRQCLSFRCQGIAQTKTCSKDKY